MKLIINTSSSLFSIKIGLIRPLLKNFKLATSEEIYEEIKEGEELDYKDARLLMHYLKEKKIEVLKAKKTKDIAKQFNIKNADASIIALTKELACFLATEDRQIEKICLLLGINVINSALLIYLLWQKKEFSGEQACLLIDLLLKNGYNKEICLKIKEKIIQGGRNV